MTAPSRPPIFADAIAGHDDVPPARAVPWLIDSLVFAARAFPDWIVDDVGIPVRLHVAGPSSIAFETNGARGVIELSAVESAWLVAVARIGETELARFYVERPYEEYELWPPHAGLAEGEAPGCIGKRATWISFGTGSWLGVAPLANKEGGVTIAVDEARLRATMRDA